MKMVASTMPGTANTIEISWSSSHSPNQPCAPNSSTSTRPAITGETANGRSISVTSRLLPRNSKRAMAQAAAMPNSVLAGTTIAAVSSVSRIAACVSGSLKLSQEYAVAGCESLRQHGAERREQQQPEEADRNGEHDDAREPRAARHAPPARHPDHAAGHQRAAARPSRRWPQPCTRLIASSMTKDIASMKKPSAAAPS